jgi:hypothetical protein
LHLNILNSGAKKCKLSKIVYSKKGNNLKFTALKGETDIDYRINTKVIILFKDIRETKLRIENQLKEKLFDKTPYKTNLVVYLLESKGINTIEEVCRIEPNLARTGIKRLSQYCEKQTKSYRARKERDTSGLTLGCTVLKKFISSYTLRDISHNIKVSTKSLENATYISLPNKKFTQDYFLLGKDKDLEWNQIDTSISAAKISAFYNTLDKEKRTCVLIREGQESRIEKYNLSPFDKVIKEEYLDILRKELKMLGEDDEAVINKAFFLYITNQKISSVYKLQFLNYLMSLKINLGLSTFKEIKDLIDFIPRFQSVTIQHEESLNNKGLKDSMRIGQNLLSNYYRKIIEEENNDNYESNIVNHLEAFPYLIDINLLDTTFIKDLSFILQKYPLLIYLFKLQYPYHIGSNLNQGYEFIESIAEYLESYKYIHQPLS